MSDLPRHQCLIYTGAPSMAGIGSALAAAGVDVDHERRTGSLMLPSDQSHLKDGRFEPDMMLARLRTEIARALADGYVGLWASGDMAWEFGPERDFSKLMEYEQGLEALFRAHPTLSGVCQYHIDMMPGEAVGHGLSLHPTLYVNETLSHLNAQYMAAE